MCFIFRYYTRCACPWPFLAHYNRWTTVPRSFSTNSLESSFVAGARLAGPNSAMFGSGTLFRYLRVVISLFPLLVSAPSQGSSTLPCVLPLSQLSDLSLLWGSGFTAADACFSPSIMPFFRPRDMPKKQAMVPPRTRPRTKPPIVPPATAPPERQVFLDLELLSLVVRLRMEFCVFLPSVLMCRISKTDGMRRLERWWRRAS